MFQPGVDARVARNVTKRWHTFVESRTARPKNTVITITNEIRAQNVSHTIATDGPFEADPHGSEKKNVKQQTNRQNENTRKEQIVDRPILFLAGGFTKVHPGDTL